MILTDTFYPFLDANEIMSWTLKHPENWSPSEVLDWLYYSADKRGVDCSLLRGEAFRTVNGERLCKMTLNDFTTVEPCYGRLFHDLLREQIACGKLILKLIMIQQNATRFSLNATRFSINNVCLLRKLFSGDTKHDLS